MKIQIGDYLIYGKKGDIIVAYQRVITEGDKKGEVVDVDRRYFSRLYQALTYLMDLKITEADIVDIKSLRTLIHDAVVEIKEAAGRIENHD